MGFPGGSVVKSPPANARDANSIPGSGRSLEKEMTTHFSIIFLKNKYLFIYLQFCIFVGAEALLLRALLQLWQAGAALHWWCTGFSLQWHLLWSTGPRCTDLRSCSTQAHQLQCLCSRSDVWVQLLHGMWNIKIYSKTEN